MHDVYNEWVHDATYVLCGITHNTWLRSRIQGGASKSLHSYVACSSIYIPVMFYPDCASVLLYMHVHLYLQYDHVVRCMSCALHSTRVLSMMPCVFVTICTHHTYQATVSVAVLSTLIMPDRWFSMHLCATTI